MTTPKPVNLALQGGGAHGAVTWGVLDRLLEDDRVKIDSISGTSAGAVNAAALAYGLHLGGAVGARAKLDELWKAISDVGSVYSPVRRSPWDAAWGVYSLENSMSYMMFDIFTRTLSPYQFNPFDINPLREVLERCIDFEEMQKCDAVQLYLSATNVRSGKVKVFRAADISADVVLASACLPVLYQAVLIDGEHYWDGGYMGNPVLFPFIYEAASRDIIIVHVNPLTRDAIPINTSEIMNRINEISFNSSLLRELRAIAFVHKLLDDGWLKDEYCDKLRHMRIHSIRSDRALEKLSVASKFNVEWEFLTELKNRGRKIAEEWLESAYADIGQRSSVDIRSMFDSTYVDEGA